jgi:hypothetical protein
MAAWEWLDGQMYALVPLQVVVAIEALWALITAKWAVILRILRLCMAVNVLQVCCVSAVEAVYHSRSHAAN